MIEESLVSPAPFATVTGGLLLGGSSTFLVNLARGLRDFGKSLPIVCLSDSNEHESDFPRSAALSVMKDPGLIYEDRLAWGYAQLVPVKPRAVIACLAPDSFELLRLVPPGVLRVGMIQSDHKAPYETAARYAPWIDIMVGVSSEISQTLESMAEFRLKPVRTIPYGIHFGDIAPKALPAPTGPLRVIYVGRLIEEQKRVSRLVALAKQLEADSAPVRLTLVGSGPQEAEVRAQLAESTVANVLGEVPNEKIAALLREHDVFILLSDYEGLPLALLEAMGNAVVPVVSDLPSGIRQAVTDEVGIRVPVGDIPAASAALKMLAGDRVRLNQMATSAQQRTRQKFSANRMAQQYIDLVEERSGATRPWPRDVRIPPPLGLNPLLFSGLSRRIRRWLRRARASQRESSIPL